MKKHSFTVFLSVFAVMLTFVSTLQAKVYLDIYGTTFKKITIGVPPLKGEKSDSFSGDMSALLNKDLDLSGFFITAPASLIDRELLDEGIERQEINFGNWRSVGIDLVCKGRVQVKDGEMTLEAFLYDALDGSMMLAKRYRSKQSEWRRVIHRLADDITLAVTGEKGIMSSRILFTAGRRNLKEVYVADFDGQNVSRLTNYRSITLSPSISPAGNYLAYTSYKEGRPHLYITDIEKKNEIFVDRSEGMKIGTAWLNKSTIIYSHTSGRSSAIYAYDIEKRSKRVIIQRDAILTSPTVSPDGSQLVFVSNMYGSPQIFSQGLASGELKRLTYYGNYNSAPAFSPKGDLIVFVARMEGGFQICTMNPDGSNQRVLTSDNAVNDSPQFSPCGRYIIYSSLRGGTNSINIMLFNGENKRTLNFTEFGEEQPKFAP